MLLDASVILAALDSDDGQHGAAHELLFEGARDLGSLDFVRYEVANVATVAWRSPEVAETALALIETFGDAGGLIHADMTLMLAAADAARLHSISVYDAAYTVAAQATGRVLVSCDQRDLVSNGLAVLPGEIV